MMQDIPAVLIGVRGEPQSNGKTRYVASLSDGNEYSFWKVALYNKAYGLQNQNVTARVELKPKQDGDGYWYNLEDIAPSGGMPPQAMPAQPGTPAQQAPPQQQFQGPGLPQQQAPPQQGLPPMPPQGGQPGGQIPQQRRGGMTDEDKARISRLGASGTAFAFVGSIYAGLGPEALPDAVKYARMLTGEILSHGWTGSFDAPDPSAQVSSPGDVAAQVNQVAGEGAVQQGSEIPWGNQG